MIDEALREKVLTPKFQRMRGFFVAKIADQNKNKHNEVKRALERRKIPLVSAKYREDAERHATVLHRDYDGFVTVAKKVSKKKWHQWHFDVAGLHGILQNLMDVEDIYLSMNAFWTQKRRMNTVRHLKSFWADVDYYKVSRYAGKTTEEMIEIFRKDGMFRDTGEPSFFVDSGNGMYCIWLIESCPKQMLPVWQVVEKSIQAKFKKYGADESATDVPRVLRLSGTENSKTGRRARFIQNGDNEVKVYNIQDMIESVLPPLKYTKEEWLKIKAKKRKSKKDRQAQKVVSMYNLHALNFARLQDLEKLVEIREGRCKGMREIMCFLYRYWSCCYTKEPEQALQQMHDFNSMFDTPREDVERLTRSAERAYELLERTFESYNQLDEKPALNAYFRKAGCYIYSNKRLIELLGITQEEMKHLSTIIDTKEKNARSREYRAAWKRQEHRNADGLTAREQAKQEKIQKVHELLEEGFKQKEIAELMGIAKGTVSKYAKEEVSKKLPEFDMNEFNEKFTRVDTSDIEAVAM